MSKIGQFRRIVTHPRELRMALSGLGMRLGGDAAFGGLTDQETEAIVRWVNEASPRTFVEIGTLFGFTAKAVAQRTTAKVVAVDLFCWNPFGLTPDEHERFTRRVLDGSGVELVRDDSLRYLSSIADAEGPMVFLDGDHRYEAVKAELEILKAKGVKFVAGHDFGNPRFGVTRAVREVVGEPDEVVGMCWFKRMA